MLYRFVFWAFLVCAVSSVVSGNAFAQMTVKELPLNRTPAWKQYVSRLQSGASPKTLPPLQIFPSFGGGPGLTLESPAAGEVPLEWLEPIRRASIRHGVSAALLAAILKAESDFNARAVSPKGARGAMQIMPDTGRALGLQNFFDPEANLDAGASYFSSLLQEFSRTELALAAYNAGPEAVRHYGGLPPFRETQAYVARVLALFRHYSNSPGLSN
ncbi:MAG: lytic transglycosylase domain-containing protein [Desulfovibrionaceae bacterium]|nr:lytic transglycosylase domain-containing protein [Desulfovibrionaceae bacterium]